MNGKTVLGLSIIVILGVVFAYIQVEIADRNYQYQGNLFDPFPAAYQFELRDQNGEIFRMEDQKGKVVLLFFGYAHCPDVCPTTLSKFKKIHASLGDQTDRVTFVFITVDPERDTPDKIRVYLNAFHSSFIGLTGTHGELQPIWDGYYIFEEKEEVDEHAHEEDAGYLVSHTSRVYVVDPEGNLQLTFPQEMLSGAMTADIIYLLDQ